MRTFVNDWLLLAEIRECWKILDAVMFGQPFIVYFHEIHSEAVRIVVDIF